MNSEKDLFEFNKLLAYKPKDIVIYRNGVFRKEHLEAEIGTLLGAEPIDEGKRKEMVKAWEEWKKKEYQ